MAITGRRDLPGFSGEVRTARRPAGDRLAWPVAAGIIAILGLTSWAGIIAVGAYLFR